MAEENRAPTRTKAFLLLGVVFVLGAICGGALFFLGQVSVGPPHRPGEPPPSHPMERLSTELDLSAEQRQAIRSILEEQRGRFDTVLEESREAIRNVLDPEQQERFDHLRPPGPGAGRPGHPPPGGRPPRRGPHPPPRRGGPGQLPPGTPPPPPDQGP